MQPTRRPNSVWWDPVHWLAFGLGAGTVPVAPGTFGTFVLGVWLCGRTARELGVHDHPGIVWDEIVGFLVTMTAAPAGWLWIVTGFVAFRFFDILKPWPIHRLDRQLGGGIGIMLDDVVAGIYGALVLRLVHWLFA
jgi:phosphatidylglycerophosphatase A